MTLAASSPTRGGAKPATPAAPLAPALPAAPAASSSSSAPAASAWHGKTKALPFIIGAGLALALADTRAAPLVIAVLSAAVIFQLMQL